MSALRDHVYDGLIYQVPSDADDAEADQLIKNHLDRGGAKSVVSATEKSPEKLVASGRTVDPTTESEGTFQEIAEGAVSGLTKAVQGVAEVGGIAIDGLIAPTFGYETNTLETIGRAGEASREFLGEAIFGDALDPVGIGGTLAEVGTQLVVPGGIAVAALSKVSKLAKLEKSIRQARLTGRGRDLNLPDALTSGQKFALRAQQGGAALAADFVVADDGMTTIGDFVEGGPTVTERDIGLTGTQEAGRQFRNKLRVGAEAGLVTTSFPYFLQATGYAVKPVATAAGAILEPTIRVSKDVVGNLAEQISKTDTARAITEATIPGSRSDYVPIAPDTTVGDLIEGTKARLRFRGNLDQATAEKRAQIRGAVDSQANAAARVVKDLERAMKKVFKRSDKVKLDDQTEISRLETMNAIYGFITKNPEFQSSAVVRRAAIRKASEGRGSFDVNNPDDLIEAVPEFARQSALDMRQQIDDLSRQILDTEYAQQIRRDEVAGIESAIIGQIQDGLGRYMRRSYKIFDDPDAYLSSREFIRNRARAAEFLRENPATARTLYNEYAITARDELGQLAENAPVTETVINDTINSFINRYRKRAGPKTPLSDLSRVAQDRMNRDIFRKRTLDQEVLRILLGELTDDPATAFVRTVGDLAETIAVDDFYGFMLSNRGRLVENADGTRTRVGGKEIIDGTLYDRLNRAAKAEYEELTDVAFGPLRSRGDNPDLRVYARTPVKRDLTRNAQQYAPVANQLLATFLLGKGFTQKVKTVYSPITQIRNVTSAALFALAQGNVGRGANVYESVALVLENIKKSGPEERTKFFRELQELGVVGTQAQLRELERVIEDGLTRASTSEIDALGIDIAQKRSRSRGGQFFAKVDTRLRDLYQGGDDIWKIYNFDFERSKMINAFGGDIDAAETYVRSITNSAGEPVYKSLNEYAADIVKNTVPNYDRVPEFVQSIRRLPIGNFVAFPAEIIRTSVNTVSRGIDEVQRGRGIIEDAQRKLRELNADDITIDSATGARLSPEGVAARRAANQNTIQVLREQIKAGKKVRDIGRRRVASFAMTSAVMGPAVQKTALLATGLGSDSIDALREIVAPWSKNSTLIPTSVEMKKGDDGKERPTITGYVDFSFFNPYDYLFRPVRGILNAIDDGRELDLNPQTTAFNLISNVISEMAGPFAEESIITERILDVTLRGGRTQSDAVIHGGWGPGEDDSALKKSLIHIFEAFQPTPLLETYTLAGIDPATERPAGIIPFVINMATELEADTELLLPGRFAAAFFEEGGLDKRGNVRMIGEEVLRQLTGIGEVKVNPKLAFTYRTLEHNKAARRPQSRFNAKQRVMARTVESPEKMIENYIQANEQKFKVFNKAYRLVENMRRLGMTRSEMKAAAKDIGFIGFDKIVDGKFEPINIKDELINDIGNFYDSLGQPFNRTEVRTELNKIRRDYKTRKLTAMPEEDDEPQRTSKYFPINPAPVEPEITTTEVAPAPAAPVEMGAAPILPSVAAPAPTPPGPLTTDLGSLVKDPRTRELVERQRGLG